MKSSESKLISESDEVEDIVDKNRILSTAEPQRKTCAAKRLLRSHRVKGPTGTAEALGAFIMPKIPEILVGIQMEKSVSVSSHQNIRDHLWRWSTYFGWNIPTEIGRSIFDKPVLCLN